jgi:hypothetical protein
MISFLLAIMFKQESRKIFSFSHVIYEVLNLFLTMTLIYFAGKSLTFSPERNLDTQINYLHFLFFGEIALILPLGLGDKVITQYTNLKANGFFQTIISLGHDPLKFVVQKSFIESYILIIRLVLMMILGELFLNTDLKLMNVINFFIPQFIGVFFFLFLALLFIYFHWEFNRGLKLFYSFQTILSLFAGQFFPREILPFEMSGLLKYLPHSLILDQSRSPHFSIGNTSILLAWALFLGLSFLLLRKATIYRLKRKSLYFA